MAAGKKSDAKPIRLDAINRKILACFQQHADMTNIQLAERVGLSPAACSQRVNALKEAGVVLSFHAEVDLDRICEHVLAYVEFTLAGNDPAARSRFVDAIERIPEFMDCVRLAGDIEYISFTCCPSISDLNRLCDQVTGDIELGVTKAVPRIIIERAKWFYGYPISRLKWLTD